MRNAKCLVKTIICAFVYMILEYTNALGIIAKAEMLFLLFSPEISSCKKYHLIGDYRIFVDIRMYLCICN